MTRTRWSSGISVSYAGNRAVDGADVASAPASMVGMVGANGAGKSTLMNALAGWSRGPPRSRQITLCRRAWTPADARRVRAGWCWCRKAGGSSPT